MTKPITFIGLCHRCEHRAVWHETKARPRYECGAEDAVAGCYMYKPVKPVVLVKVKGDRRPLGGGPMIGARAHGRPAGEKELMLRGHIRKRNELLMTWEVTE